MNPVAVVKDGLRHLRVLVDPLFAKCATCTHFDPDGGPKPASDPARPQTGEVHPMVMAFKMMVVTYPFRGVDDEGQLDGSRTLRTTIMPLRDALTKGALIHGPVSELGRCNARQGWTLESDSCGEWR